MRLNLLRDMLMVPSVSGHEDYMVEFLEQHIKARGGRCGTVYKDKFKNVYVLKGNARTYPCLAAHIDTVHPIDQYVTVKQEGDIMVGYDRAGNRAGIGGDDKAGVMVCLEALERLDTVACCFFAQEEVGHQGASNSSPVFFDHVSYVVEWDCPSSNLMSYTSGGVRLFANNGEFIKRALPVLQKRNILWQKHPYTDVRGIRSIHPLSCLNLSSGYYNWHQNNEYVRISETAASVEMAVELVQAIGEQRFEFPIHHHDRAVPLVEVTALEVRDNALVETT